MSPILGLALVMWKKLKTWQNLHKIIRETSIKHITFFRNSNWIAARIIQKFIATILVLILHWSELFVQRWYNFFFAILLWMSFILRNQAAILEAPFWFNLKETIHLKALVYTKILSHHTILLIVKNVVYNDNNVSRKLNAS